MPENTLSPEQLKTRWETPIGQKFRGEILRQLQSEESGHSVDWENLRVEHEGDNHHWKDFPGVSELPLAETQPMNKVNIIDRNNYLQGDLRGIKIQVDEKTENASLGFSMLYYADLIFTHLEFADFNWAHLEYAHLSGSHLENTKLNRAHLKNALINGAHLKNADLSWSDLRGTNL